ncbi:WD40 repeat-like protein [Dacryopinax primogenitus]|uniref:WD40 repeat-like protein n=1 Tax=Dacryopinax primogenitus (strain DJM 731) TaxID=1858805 RepID=M5FY60_DACPD|nr:WD40 repeat-like protein [Dacryopinax primogenitus]EJT98496.1 WD40 repeat-like protein [Dacryopinax primogenitus]
MASNEHTVLPQITIQPTYPSVLADVNSSLVTAEDIWISCYLEGRNSVHGKVRISRERDAPGGVKLEARNGVQVEWVNSSVLRVSCPSLDIPPTLVRFPRQSIPVSPGTQITTLSPSPDLSLLATGSASGSITLIPLSTPDTPNPSAGPQTFTPHLSTVLSVRILPSSQVILSSGSDCQLHISPVVPPLTPARVLSGHKRGVTDTYIVDRGRQVVSCAKDGTVRVWDVAAGKSARMLAGIVPPAEMDLSYLQPDAPAVNGTAPSTNGSIPEQGHLPLLAVALSSGLFTLLDLRVPSSQTIYTSPKTSTSSSNALQSIALSPTQIYTGSLKGQLNAYDLRHLPSPLWSTKRNGSSIEDLVLSSQGLAVASEDGLPYLIREGHGGPEVAEEWAGWECDAVRCLRAEGGSVWAGGNDGVVRRY